MRKIKIYFYILFLFFFLIFILTGCNNEITSEDTKSKIMQELEYLDTQIVSISNGLNNISLENYTITSEEITLGQENTGGSSGESSGSSEGTSEKKSSSGGESSTQQSESDSQSKASGDSGKNKVTITGMKPNTILTSDENDINWDNIKNEIETINEAWGIVVLDLSNFNVDNNDILSFSETLDNCILSIKDENKVDTLSNISRLYSIIPKFEREVSAENSMQNIKQVKSYIINAYSLVEKDDWTGIESNMLEAEKNFKNITNDIEYIKDKEYKVNKTYVLIKELQNSIPSKDKKLFYVKYKNLMESINTM